MYASATYSNRPQSAVGTRRKVAHWLDWTISQPPPASQYAARSPVQPVYVRYPATAIPATDKPSSGQLRAAGAATAGCWRGRGAAPDAMSERERLLVRFGFLAITRCAKCNRLPPHSLVVPRGAP